MTFGKLTTFSFVDIAPSTQKQMKHLFEEISSGNELLGSTSVGLEGVRVVRGSNLSPENTSCTCFIGVHSCAHGFLSA